MLRRVAAEPAAAWRSCQVIQAGRRPRKVRYLDQTVALPQYQGSVRQLVVCGLGHEKPTFLLTNDLPRRLPARQVLMDYAARNRVEHNLGEKITFFHMDCLASEVRLNFEKRSHNPILKEAGLERLTGPIPWCQNLRLRMIFP